MALHPAGEPGPYPAEVRHRIRRDFPADHGGAAQALNDCGVSVVSLQHEFGIWGGEDGVNVLDFVHALRIPFVATLHTVPPQPTPAQRAILSDIATNANASVVMSKADSALMTRVYGADPARLSMIPHGVPNLPIVAADTMKPRLGLTGQAVILSFGLMGPGKGFEAAIAAMPAVVAAVPSASYVILGATHPDVRSCEGETYRATLEAQVAKLGLGDHVKFVNRFVGRVELGTWLQAADVFATPYSNMVRTVSGTLAYAMGAGKAIVSTPYSYASEMLAGDRGRLVRPGDTAALSETFIELLLDADLRASLGRRAYEQSRGMVWWEVGSQYRRLFEGAARAAAAMPIRRNTRLAASVA